MTIASLKLSQSMLEINMCLWSELKNKKFCFISHRYQDTSIQSQVFQQFLNSSPELPILIFVNDIKCLCFYICYK